VARVSRGGRLGPYEPAGDFAVLRSQQRRCDGAAVGDRGHQADVRAAVHQSFNVYRGALVTGAAAPGYSSGQALDALEDTARRTLPPEIAFDWSDLSYQEKKAGGSGALFALSITFVFLILAALYESWSLPFSVLLSVPIAVFGAVVGLFIRHYDFDVYAQIGIVMLIGLAAKNAILIVEFAKARLEEGMSLVDAALEGAKTRLRPI